MADYTILSAPRMTAAGFAAVLAAAHSPAAPEAAAAYNAFASSGVDPAVALAMFRKESSFGTAGRAVANKSWGNIRGGTGYPTDSGGFRIYPSWAVGALDAARLMTVYGSNGIRPGVKTDTVLTLPFVWAPSSDGNAPAAYGAQLATWVGQYASSYPSGGGSGVIFAVNQTTPASPSILAEFLATIGRQESDLIRDQDVMPFLQFLQRKQIVPGGDLGNGAVNAVVIELRKLVGRPWTDVGPQFQAAAQAPNDPFGIGAALGSFGVAVGQIATRAVILAALVGLVILGLYLTVKE